MPFDFGDIVLVPFPFTSLTVTKLRPAVVVSNAAYNVSRPDVIVMAITSQFRPLPGIGEVWIGDWQSAGLLKPSVIKPVFATIEQKLIVRRLGSLQSSGHATLRAAIAAILG